MNTVDALKKLYKKLTGKDWSYDPNPTDAEVISAIAKDATTGGGSGGGGSFRVIEWAEYDPENPHYVATIEPGLEPADFFNTILYTGTDYIPLSSIQPGQVDLSIYYGNTYCSYDPTTGIITNPE